MATYTYNKGANAMKESKMKKVYVVGHKNPDTDSICSAIAYANLKSLKSLLELVFFLHIPYM